MPAVIGRILRSTDFERVLGSPSRARSVHFAVHFLPSRPSRPVRTQKVNPPADLSTGEELSAAPAVDDTASQPVPDQVWLGTVVPKRHARRSVTRNLLKRQIHRAVAEQACATEGTALPLGLWVVRLRSGFDRKHFSSAASDALQAAAAEELSAVMAHAARRAAR